MIPKLRPVAASSLGSLAKDSFDGLVLLFHSSLSGLNLPASLSSLNAAIQEYASLDAAVSKGTSPTLVVTATAPGNRLILSNLGSLLGDTDDVRRFTEASRKALAKCASVGIKRPLILMPSSSLPTSNSRFARDFVNRLHVTLLGLLAESYVPLQTREHKGLSVASFEEIGFVADDNSSSESVARLVDAIEQGRFLARDVGGSDPERMAPLRCAQHIARTFKDVENINLTVITDPEVLRKEYPLLHAVARCSLAVSRHLPAVVRLEYRSPEPKNVKENIFLVGKGVTYDTGGADIKYGGVMRGMSRDKCGAAACAGFMKTVSLLAPKHVNVIADLGFVRNSAGPDNYVSDEIIMSRAGVRVLIGNTDAEGRMVMGDLLAHAKERALSPEYRDVPSRLFTVATLTGHAIRAVGTGYSISLDNGPAREAGISSRLFKAGHLIGEPFETSTLRREDYEFVAPGASTEDVVQANEKPSTMTSRGHQYPAAFLAVASGLNKHGLDSDSPLCYTHVDIAGSAEEGGSGLSLAKVTGAPVAAFTNAFLL